jgi:hypothetical protein
MIEQRVKTGLVSPQPFFPKSTDGDLLKARRSNAEGLIIDRPPQYGGDAYLVVHENPHSPAIYWENEFEIKTA